MKPPTPLVEYLSQHGRPISYGYLTRQYPLSDYQTVYARQPAGAEMASAEMASAGRPFTESLLVRLMAMGVAIAPVVLHAGVSSPELHEPPAPERFEVPEPTARLVQSTRDFEKRVVAVGATMVRALETAAAPALNSSGMRMRPPSNTAICGTSSETPPFSSPNLPGRASKMNKGNTKPLGINRRLQCCIAGDDRFARQWRPFDG